MFFEQRCSREISARRRCPGCGRSMFRFPADRSLCPTCALLASRLQGSFQPGAAALGGCLSLWRDSDSGIVVIAYERPGELARRLVRGCRRGDKSCLRASAAVLARRLWVRGFISNFEAIVPLRGGRDVPLARTLTRKMGLGISEGMGKLTLRLAVTDVFSERARAATRESLTMIDSSATVVAALIRE